MAEDGRTVPLLGPESTQKVFPEEGLAHGGQTGTRSRKLCHRQTTSCTVNRPGAGLQQAQVPIICAVLPLDIGDLNAAICHWQTTGGAKSTRRTPGSKATSAARHASRLDTQEGVYELRSIMDMTIGEGRKVVGLAAS